MYPPLKKAGAYTIETPTELKYKIRKLNLEDDLTAIRYLAERFRGRRVLRNDPVLEDALAGLRYYGITKYDFWYITGAQEDGRFINFPS
jgi:hypothetical protein